MIGRPRVVVELHAENPGPTLIFVGGMHGNEPAGVEACEKLLAAEPRLSRGDVWAFAGNTRALEAGYRFIDRDFNRSWTPALVERALSGKDGAAEAFEVRELAEEIELAMKAARGPVVFVDLHTTSAAGIPFALIGDTLPHRDFAAHLPLPVILGLEEQIDGCLTEWMTAKGAVTLVVEGGQHESAEAFANLEAVTWACLAAAGVIDGAAEPKVAAAHDRLARARGELPHFIEVKTRHGITPSDEFVMEPGFATICRVKRGQLLARDRHGLIHAPADGLVLLPLYQQLGDDGFFFGNELGSVSLKASRASRKLKLDSLLPLLPGVRRKGDRLAISPKAATIYPQSLFTHFGYRRRTDAEASVLVSRRVDPTRQAGRVQ